MAAHGKEKNKGKSQGETEDLCCGSKTMLILGWLLGGATLEGRIIGRAPFIMGLTGLMVMPGLIIGLIIGLAPGLNIGLTLPGLTVGRIVGFPARTLTGILAPPLLMVAPPLRMVGPPLTVTPPRTLATLMGAPRPGAMGLGWPLITLPPLIGTPLAATGAPLMLMAPLMIGAPLPPLITPLPRRPPRA